MSLACWCWSCAQARHGHSGRSGCIAATSPRPDERGEIAGFGLVCDLVQGQLMIAEGNRGAGGPGGPTRPVDGWLDQRTGAARLVTHHEVPFFVAVEGFARVLAPVVLAHRWGHFSLGRWPHLRRHA
jgi:hypothetical protein